MKQSDRSAAKAAWIVLGAITVLLLLGWLRERTGSSGVTAERARGEARRLEFPLVSGAGLWRLEDERGHVVAVNLWATWCGPCREETPMLVRLAHERSAVRRGFGW